MNGNDQVEWLEKQDHEELNSEFIEWLESTPRNKQFIDKVDGTRVKTQRAIAMDVWYDWLNEQWINSLSAEEDNAYDRWKDEQL